jgi:hypothetical protein
MVSNPLLPADFLRRKRPLVSAGFRWSKAQRRPRAALDVPRGTWMQSRPEASWQPDNLTRDFIPSLGAYALPSSVTETSSLSANAGNRCAAAIRPGDLRPSVPKVCVQSEPRYAFICGGVSITGQQTSRADGIAPLAAGSPRGFAAAPSACAGRCRRDSQTGSRFRSAGSKVRLRRPRTRAATAGSSSRTPVPSWTPAPRPATKLTAPSLSDGPSHPEPTCAWPAGVLAEPGASPA